MRKLLAVACVLLVFSCFETVLAIDYVSFLETGSSPVHGSEEYIQGQPTVIQNTFLFFWRNSLSFSATGWVIVGVTFFRKGISQKWRRLGFDKEVFQLMINMRGAKSRLTLLNYLGEPRQRAELSKLSGLDWKEVDREIDLLQRFGLITLYVQSGSVKLYRLNEQGKLMLKLITELRERLPSEFSKPEASSPQ